MVEITLQIPDDLAADAADFGLLTSATLLTVLREEVDRRVMDLVNAEIKAYRAEKAARERQNGHPE
jgi:post-segregation antitoxin (ccd killing protein)